MINMRQILKRKVFWIILSSVIVLLLLWQTALIELIILARFNGSQDTDSLALSFDDGPDWGEEMLLSELNAAGMRATFFWTWEKVEILSTEDNERFERLLSLIQEGGHELGIHGYYCRGSQNLLARFLVGNDSASLYSLSNNFNEMTGKKPKLYRSHGPRAGRQFYNQLRESELELILGSLTHQISTTYSEDVFIEYFSKAPPGTIICAHDSRNCAADYGLATRIARIVPELARIVEERGIDVVTVSDLNK
jgi:hypothetical protein